MKRLTVRVDISRDVAPLRRILADGIGAFVFFICAFAVLSGDVSAAIGAAAPVHAGISFGLTEIADRNLLVGMMALFFAAMCTVTMGLWRRLRREEASPRRHGRRI